MRVLSPGAVDTIDEYSRSDADGRRGDGDRALHARVLTDGRQSLGRGDARGHRPDDTAATIAAMSVPSVDLPRFRAVRRAVAVGATPRLLRALGRTASRSGSSARTCCRSRSVATSCATSSSWSVRPWPRAPTRRHERPALVQPLPVDRGRRGEGWAWRGARAVGAAGGSARPGRRAHGGPWRCRASAPEGGPGGSRIRSRSGRGGGAGPGWAAVRDRRRRIGRAGCLRAVPRRSRGVRSGRGGRPAD